MTTCSSKSAFFLIRKELRSISGKFWTLSFELRQLERQMNILDARGQGQGLSQADVKVYRNAQARQWWLEERLQAIAHPLQAYGQQLVALLAEIGQDLTPEERLALLGGRHQAFRGPSWEGCTLEQLVLRHRVESAAEGASTGPIATALMAHHGQLRLSGAKSFGFVRRKRTGRVASQTPVRPHLV